MSDSNVRVVSLNTRGSCDRTKCKSVFQYLRKQADVIFVQETHLNCGEVKRLWQMEWGSPIYAAYGETNARGTMIMLNINRTGTALVKKVKTDTEGQMVCCLLEYNAKKYVLCNIYTPNSDCLSFFKKVIETVESYNDYDAVIIGGDFNLVMDLSVDRNDSLRNHTQAWDLWMEYMDHASVMDVW